MKPVRQGLLIEVIKVFGWIATVDLLSDFGKMVYDNIPEFKVVSVCN